MQRIIALFTLTLLLSACQALAVGQPEVVIALLTKPSTPVVGACSITVLLHNSSGKPIQRAHVVIEGTSLFPGTTPIQSVTHERAPGVYDTRLVWPQAGSWLVIVRATLANGDIVQRQVDVPYVHAR